MPLPLVAIAARVLFTSQRMFMVLIRVGRIVQSTVSALADTAPTLRPPRITVRHNFPQVQREVEALHRDLRTKAVPRALNRLAELARTEMRRRITARYSLKATDVRERLQVRRAQAVPGGFAAELFADGRRGRSLNVARFLAGAQGKGRAMNQAQARRALKAGPRAALKVRIKKGTMKTIGPAFTPNGGKTVFRRVGKARLPIEPVQTIDVGQMFNEREINSEVVQFIERKWPEILEREMSYFVNQFNRR